MRSTIAVQEPPAKEPVTTALVRQHCRMDNASDEQLLQGYLIAARMMAEGYLSRALVAQTLLWTMRPESLLHPEQSRLLQPLELPRAPVQSIASVTLLDEYGNSTVIPPATLPIMPPPFSGYVADISLEPGRLTIGPDTPLTGGKTLRWTRIQHLQVAMECGYPAISDVPQNIVQAIMMMTAYSYEHRGDDGGEMPEAAYRLLDRSRLQFFGG